MPYTPGTGSKLGELLRIWDTDTLTTFPDMVLPLFIDQSNIEVKHRKELILHLRRKMITKRTKVRLSTLSICLSFNKSPNELVSLN